MDEVSIVDAVDSVIRESRAFANERHNSGIEEYDYPSWKERTAKRLKDMFPGEELMVALKGQITKHSKQVIAAALLLQHDESEALG